MATLASSHHLAGPSAGAAHTPAAAPSSVTTLARGHIAELDGLRGVAILLVILHHFWPAAGPLEGAKPVVHLGWIGVDLFFVISGFLITGILLDTRGQPGFFRNYLARRVLRVFPLYYLVVIAAFVLIPLAQGGPWADTEFVRQSGSPLWYLLYAGNLREAITGTEPAYVLAVLWSLSIEEQFYLTFPVLVALVSPRTLGRILVGMVIAAPVFRLVMLVLVPDNERIQYLATPARMDVLALGALLALRVRGGAPLPPRPVLGALLAGAVAVNAVVFLAGGLDRTTAFCRVAGYSLVAVMFLLLVAWTLQGRGTLATRWLRVRALQQLGVLCYGVYLLQRPSEVVLVKLLGRTGWHLHEESGALVVLKILFTVAVAALSWWAFERRFLRLKRHFASRHHPGGAAHAAA